MCTDSATVYSWLRAMLTGERRIKTHGFGAVLAKRRLFLIDSLVKECSMKVILRLVKSAENKADTLTRVPRKWFQKRRVEIPCATGELLTNHEMIKEEHERHHLGVDRTYYLFTKRWPDVTIRKKDVEAVVSECLRCRSIDPAPVRWQPGVLDVDSVWTRVAVDITHYNSSLYLTMIDCGPSRFTIWRKLRSEGAEEVTSLVEDVFRDHGPPEELLLDNGSTFRSVLFCSMCRKWSVFLNFRCAYRPSGNGIVERIHSTIKRMAARSKMDVRDMVFYYNSSPKHAIKGDSVPRNQMYRYHARIPGEARSLPSENSMSHRYSIGQSVLVKPNMARCTSQWQTGVVTGILSPVKVEVNGMPRHVGDLRPVPIKHNCDRLPEQGGAQCQHGVDIDFEASVAGDDSESGDNSLSSDSDAAQAAQQTPPRRNTRRVSQPPARSADYSMDSW